MNLVRNVKANRVHSGEIWSLVYAKEKKVATTKTLPDGVATYGRRKPGCFEVSPTSILS
jgi:hypothetical protein